MTRSHRTSPHHGEARNGLTCEGIYGQPDLVAHSTKPAPHPPTCPFPPVARDLETEAKTPGLTQRDFVPVLESLRRGSPEAAGPEAGRPEAASESRGSTGTRFAASSSAKARTASPQSGSGITAVAGAAYSADWEARITISCSAVEGSSAFNSDTGQYGSSSCTRAASPPEVLRNSRPRSSGRTGSLFVPPWPPRTRSASGGRGAAVGVRGETGHSVRGAPGACRMAMPVFALTTAHRKDGRFAF